MNDIISWEDLLKREKDLSWSGFIRGFCFAMEFVKNELSTKPEPKWIPVAERLPEEEKKSYWICTDTGQQCECRWTNNIYGIGESSKWGWSIFDIPQYTRVIAWMPLPEPAIIGEVK